MNGYAKGMKIYTVGEVARILRVHPLTVLRYIKRGLLQAKRIGRGYRITEQGLNIFLGLDRNEFLNPQEGSDA
jgi:excisionase family DNA binding protein